MTGEECDHRFVVEQMAKICARCQVGCSLGSCLKSCLKRYENDLYHETLRREGVEK